MIGEREREREREKQSERPKFLKKKRQLTFFVPKGYVEKNLESSRFIVKFLLNSNIKHQKYIKKSIHLKANNKAIQV